MAIFDPLFLGSTQKKRLFFFLFFNKEGRMYIFRVYCAKNSLLWLLFALLLVQQAFMIHLKPRFVILMIWISECMLPFLENSLCSKQK